MFWWSSSFCDTLPQRQLVEGRRMEKPGATGIRGEVIHDVSDAFCWER